MTTRPTRPSADRRPRTARAALAGVVLAALAGAFLGVPARPAAAQPLRPENVLVIYDSRIPDSVQIAEHYAGSLAVAGPGRLGTKLGLRRGAHTLDLATTGAPLLPTGDLTHDAFEPDLRDRIQDHLLAAGLLDLVRVLVLTKGLPHRLLDTDQGVVGDNANQALTEYQTDLDYDAASVESELTLLWQNLRDNVRSGRTWSDGIFLNPYRYTTERILTFTNANTRTRKRVGGLVSPLGLGWEGITSPTPAEVLTPGDLYLTARLDSRTVAEVLAMIDRAQDIVIDQAAAVIILDESDSNGIADTLQSAAGGELDNFDLAAAPSPRLVSAGDDYERARDALLASAWTATNVRYNALAGPDEFLVGPRINFSGGQVVTGPVALLAHEGANHNGFPPNTAQVRYAESFTLADGSIFNTIESFNGRAFGTDLRAFGQEQLIDFIRGGGTLGIGHVWEPFAFTVPKNEALINAFLLGPLTWAEAAWAAIPQVSWMQIVVGDPLADAVLLSDVDLNADGLVDIEDLYAWHAAPRDVDRDGEVNSLDAMAIERIARRGE